MKKPAPANKEEKKRKKAPPSSIHSRKVKAISQILSKPRMKKHRAAIPTKDHPKNSSLMAGSDERISECIRLTMKYARMGYYPTDIAPMIARDLNLKIVPAASTVRDWRMRGHKESIGEIKEIGMEMRLDVIEKAQELLSRWFPVATAAHLSVNRLQRIEGQMEMVLDENAYDEQLKAGALCVKAFQMLLKAAGIDSLEDNEKMSPKQMHEFVLGILTGAIARPPEPQQVQGKVVEQEYALELKSGIPEAEAFDSV